jgi:hypothetical protein
MNDQMTLGDRNLACADCGTAFVLTSGEREFYARKHLAEPRRCKDCRHRRRSQQGRMADQHTPSVAPFE